MAGGHEAIRKRIGMAFTALRNQGVAALRGGYRLKVQCAPWGLIDRADQRLFAVKGRHGPRTLPDVHPCAEIVAVQQLIGLGERVAIGGKLKGGDRRHRPLGPEKMEPIKRHDRFLPLFGAGARAHMGGISQPPEPKRSLPAIA